MAELADVEIRGIAKKFGSRQVLGDVELTVPAGSVTAVLGPSGCGKSTLLRILAGFEQPDAGTVRIGGTLIADSTTSVPAHRRRVGLMPQEGALFPHRSVAGNIAFGLGRRHRTKTAAEVDRWLDVVGLEGLADARPHELSGGQQQRVALARALAARPRVLLLDEPFAALDAGLRVRVREDIISILRNAGTTALLVTHDQAEALSLADSVAVLLDGAIAQCGAPTQVYEQPSTRHVARFVGSTIELPGQSRGRDVTTALGTHRVRNCPISHGVVSVVIRPEQIQLTDAEDACGTKAVVVQKRFYGPETVVQVRVSDGHLLQLRQPSAAAGAGVDGHVYIRVVGSVLSFP